ncbi:MAG: 2-C-methyl-D-erythritol 2,4-cyclodiphosphate synthase [Gammaproteobacteria bacterium]
MRIGQGYDAHKIIPGDEIILGGVAIPSNYSIEAHSDGDVIIHAVIDAILGAFSLGDLGSHFPSSDDSYKDISSRVLLKEVMEKINSSEDIINLDITYIGEEPKLSKYIDQIRRNISKDLGINLDKVSCKATTTEGLGFQGRKEGVVSNCNHII